MAPKRIKSGSDRDHFLETFGMLRTDKRKFVYRLGRSGFSIPETRLLRAALEFQRNSKERALRELRTSPLSDPFLEGVRLYLIGLVYNQHSHFRYAVENLERSIAVLQGVDHRGFILKPLYLLILALGNRRELVRMGQLLRELDSIRSETPYEALLILHCRILYAMLTGDTALCLSLLEKETVRHTTEDLRPFNPHFLIIQIAALVKEERFKDCLSVLEHYKKTAETAIVRANYAYIKTLLHHLLSNAPLYIYASKFKEFPELHAQLETVKRLSIGDLDGALRFWGELRKHNPGLYGPDFQYLGDVSLFSKALERYRVHSVGEDWNPDDLRSIGSKRERLHFLLTRSKTPLSAERLVNLIWGEEADEKSLARLRKLISNYSRDTGARVVSSHQSYRLCRQAGDTK